LGFFLYVICGDGDYVCFGKEIEVYANHNQAVAMLMFIFDKHELGQTVWIRRFGLDPYYEKLCRRDVSKEYLEHAKEELGRLTTIEEEENGT